MKMIVFLMFYFMGVSLAFSRSVPLEGGGCEYKKYNGHARIVSIIPKRKPDNIHHEIFEVKFVFISEQNLDINFRQKNKKEKEFTLLLNNSNYPGPGFLKKYDIQVGKVFDCDKHIITRGTCSPVLFKFPTINLYDYSENKN